MALQKFISGLSFGFSTSVGDGRRLSRRTFCIAALVLALSPLAIFGQSQEGKNQMAAQGSRPFNPVYPYDALIAGKDGSAQISFTVDASGRAMLLNADSCTDKSFAQSFSADIEAVEFIPPRRNAQPLMSQARERFNFTPTRGLDAVALEILAELRKPEPNLCPAAELDAKPQPIRQPLPAYPSALRVDEESGKAEIEFVIDRSGRVLFPRIVSATHEDFGWAAATAVVRWKYKPPIRKGTPVDTRIRDTITFDIKKAEGMW